MPEEEALNFEFDVLDVTKVWPQKKCPLIPIAKMVLNRNPDNYFAEVEQAAFAPTHTVPGIEPSNDKMLQGRLFSYPDTHRHRLGANYDQIPINCPYRARVANNVRDGPMEVVNPGPSVNYEPTTMGGPVEDPNFAWSKQKVDGTTGRFKYTHKNDDYSQPRELFRRVMTEADRTALIKNIAGHLGGCKDDIKERALMVFFRIDKEYGERVAKAIGFQLKQSKI